MPRPRVQPRTVLGVALVAARGERAVVDLATDLGVHHATLSRLEQGKAKPSANTARRLARFLGWSVEQVLDAADEPAPAGSPDTP